MNKRIWLFVLTLLLILCIISWLSLLYKPESRLKIIACDVGQGDAFLISYLSTQIIVDGGPGDRLLSCLGRYTPFWDRNIELLVVTNPDADHFSGSIEVLKHYRVDRFMSTEVGKDTDVFKTLVNEVVKENAEVIFAKKDMSVRIGSIYIDILNPPSDAIASLGAVSNVLGSFITKDVNDYSIVFQLSYGEFDALFTGDIEEASADKVASYLGSTDFEYLKVPHHGSTNGLTQKLLDKVDPELAVISVGKNNRYDHPRKEILNMLESKKLKILRTDLQGDIIVVTNGRTWWLL